MCAKATFDQPSATTTVPTIAAADGRAGSQAKGPSSFRQAIEICDHVIIDHVRDVPGHWDAGMRVDITDRDLNRMRQYSVSRLTLPSGGRCIGCGWRTPQLRPALHESSMF